MQLDIPAAVSSVNGLMDEHDPQAVVWHPVTPRICATLPRFGVRSTYEAHWTGGRYRIPPKWTRFCRGSIIDDLSSLLAGVTTW